jgi:hypothetical protein
MRKNTVQRWEQSEKLKKELAYPEICIHGLYGTSSKSIWVAVLRILMLDLSDEVKIHGSLKTVTKSIVGKAINSTSIRHLKYVEHFLRYRIVFSFVVVLMAFDVITCL